MEDNKYSTEEQIAAEKAIEIYNKFWNIKPKEEFQQHKRYKNPATFDTEIGKNVGDIWQLPNGKWVEKKEDRLLITSKHPLFHKEIDESVSTFQKKMSTCPKCGKVSKNPNEIKVMGREKMCYTCIADEELNDIIEGKELQFGIKPKEKPENDIIIKNSEGKPLMSLAEFRQEYGDEAADKLRNEGIIDIPQEEKDERYSPREIQQMAMRIKAEQDN